MAAPVTSKPVASPEPRESAMQRVFGALGAHPYYRSYWLGNQANTLVMQMQQVANGYLAYTLTNSANELGVVAFAQSLPMLVLSPVGGVLADRHRNCGLLLWIPCHHCCISLIFAVYAH